MLRKDAKIERLRAVPLFAACSKRELAEIASIADEIDLPAGRELMREGELGHEFFVFLDGTAHVRRRGRKVATLGAGDFAGEIALLATMRRTATVSTTSPVRALVVTKPNFRRLLRRMPGIQVKLLQTLAERLAPSAL